MKTHLVVACSLLMAIPSAASAGGVGKAAQEAAELLMKKFGKEVASEGAEKLAGRIALTASRHGDDVLGAVRKVGPRALRLADDAGEHAPQAMRLLTRYGDDAARVLSRPKGMALVVRYGDDATSALIQHPGVAEPLLEGIGAPAIKALGAVGARNGRRLAMMAEGGDLAALGRTPEVMGVIARYGDPAMEFIWRHKGVLAGGAVLTAFIANPEPYLDGTRQLTETVATKVVMPVASKAIEGGTKTVDAAASQIIKPVVTEMAKQAAMRIAWGTVSVLGILLLGGMGLLFVYLRRPVPATAK